MSGKPVLKVSPLASGGIQSSAASVAEIVRSVTIPAGSVTTATTGQQPMATRSLARAANEATASAEEKSEFYLVRLFTSETCGVLQQPTPC